MRTVLFKKLFKKKPRDDIQTYMEFAESFKNYKKTQMKFQQNDGVPVFLKGGWLDKFLFSSTIFISALGIIETFKFIHSMSHKSKSEHNQVNK